MCGQGDSRPARRPWHERSSAARAIFSRRACGLAAAARHPISQQHARSEPTGDHTWASMQGHMRLSGLGKGCHGACFPRPWPIWPACRRGAGVLSRGCGTKSSKGASPRDPRPASARAQRKREGERNDPHASNPIPAIPAPAPNNHSLSLPCSRACGTLPRHSEGPGFTADSRGCDTAGRCRRRARIGGLARDTDGRGDQRGALQFGAASSGVSAGGLREYAWNWKRVGVEMGFRLAEVMGIELRTACPWARRGRFPLPVSDP
jgi:hypothetical protein